MIFQDKVIFRVINNVCILSKIVRVCAEKDKLMSVHLRRAEEEAISILKNIVLVGALFIGLMETESNCSRYVDIGCYFSLNSNMVTNEKSKKNCI